MKVSFLLDNVNKKLPWVSRIVSSRSEMPILSSVLIEAAKGKIEISATDLETGIIIEAPANIEEEGRVVVSSKTFIEILGNLTGEKVNLETEDDKKIIIKTKNTKTTLSASSEEEYPKIYEEKGKEWARLSAEELEREIKRVVIAASVDGERADLSGVLIKKDGSSKTFVATDGYRLSLQVKKEKGGEKEEKEIIIPARLLRDQVSMRAGVVQILYSEKTNQVILKREEAVVVGRLIQAKFPDYQRILPTEYSTKAVFDRKEMQQAIKMCVVFAREASNVIKFSVGKNKITVSANAPTLGEGTVDVAAKVEGEENDIAFNARYLTELLANIDDEEMILEMTSPVAPGVFKIVGDDSFLHLIMPIRVQE